MDYAHHRADDKRMVGCLRCKRSRLAFAYITTSQGVMHSVRGMCISFSGGYNDVFYDRSYQLGLVWSPSL